MWAMTLVAVGRERLGSVGCHRVAESAEKGVAVFDDGAVTRPYVRPTGAGQCTVSACGGHARSHETDRSGEVAASAMWCRVRTWRWWARPVLAASVETGVAPPRW